MLARFTWQNKKLLFIVHAIRRGGYQPPAQYKLKIARNVGRIRTSFPHLYHSTKHSGI